MPSPRRFALLLAALALLVAGCGSSNKGKLNDFQANRLTQQVQNAESAADEGQCGDAQTAAARGADIAAGFKSGVDEKLRNNLVNGFNHLSKRIGIDCGKKTPTPTPTPSPTETPEETVTEVPTEAPTVEPTETPTEIPTEAPTEAPTTAPTTTPTSVLGGAKANP